MRIDIPSFEIWQQEPGVAGIYRQIERVGRVCYKSEDHTTATSAQPFVERMIKSEHFAMLEHGTVYLVFDEKTREEVGQSNNKYFDVAPWMFYMNNKYSQVNFAFNNYYVTTNLRVLAENNRLYDLQAFWSEPLVSHPHRVTVHFSTQIAITREFNRHRADSMAEQSTRYCNYSKAKFGNEITINLPVWIRQEMTGSEWAGQVKGGLLIGMAFTTIAAMGLGLTKMPATSADIFNLVPPVPVDTFAQLDVMGAIKYGIFSIIFSITIVDMFDNIGTLIGVTRKANLVDENGKFENLDKALLCTSIGAAAGAVAGTSTVTSYIESAAAVADGGRTGLTAVVTGLLYLGSLFFAPLFLLVPVQATAPVLITIGVFMMSEVTHIDFTDFTEALPAFLTILLMPLTFSIAQGLSFGFISYTLIKLTTGRRREIHPIMYIMTVAFIIHFAI